MDPVTLACDLLRCPSVTPREAGALALIETVLKDAGFEVHRVTFAQPGTLPVENLYARIGSTGPHLVFAGHTDVQRPHSVHASRSSRSFQVKAFNELTPNEAVLSKSMFFSEAPIGSRFAA